MINLIFGINENNFEVTPRVVLNGALSRIKISPVGEKFAFSDAAYILNFIPMECSEKTNVLTDHDTVQKSRTYGLYDTLKLVPTDGFLEFEYRFTAEQEWVIAVSPEGESGCVIKFHIYSLNADLYERLPYIGDFHTHSCYSDGAEEPAVVAANFRKSGYDFLALTDHHIHASSVKMTEDYKDVLIDMKLFYGEEVHLLKLGGYMHAVNFGGRQGVTDYFEENPEKCKEEISRLEKSLDVPSGLNRYECAFRKWVADKIHEFGGLAIIAHPFWITLDEYNMRPGITEWLIKNKIYDAMEAASGQTVEENCLQAAFYNELRAKGIKVPIVGASDTHATDPGWYFKMGKTLLFAKGGLDFESIRESIDNLYTVSIESQEKESERIVGPYRMVKYAQFLLKYYFPRHDDLCVEEGIAMKKYFNKEEGARKALESLKGRTKRLAKEFYGLN